MAKRVNPDGTRRPKVRLRDKPHVRMSPVEKNYIKMGMAVPRKGKDPKQLVEEQRLARKKTDLFARFRRLMASTFKKELPPGVKVK